MDTNVNKPIIGLIPLWDDTRESVWMLPGYMNAVLHAGGIPITLPFTDNEDILNEVCSRCNGFILTGGHDIDPSLYGESPNEKCGISCPTRDAMEKTVLSYALEHDLPMLGICRGHQFLNAALGGTLYRDLPTEHPSETAHRQKPPYHLPAHTVSIVADSPLSALLNRSSLSVNSRHHQAIDRIAPILKPMAISEDGLIEAVWLPGKRFVWGVQWHPEHSFETDSASMSIFTAFVEASRS